MIISPEIAQDIPLPRLRPDLQIFDGPLSRDGSPTYTLYDPMARTFDKISWDQMAILERLQHPQTLKKLSADLVAATTLRVSSQELLYFCQDLVARGLTRATPTRPVKELEDAWRSRRFGPIKWLLLNYLFFRIPLIRPENFLKKTVHAAAILVSRPALFLYLVTFLAGLVMIVERGGEYFQTFTYFFNLRGLIFYGLVIVVLKIIHEFSHAYCATYYGLRVPVMGIAFMVLWPVAYCDVTDAWKLTSRRQRFLIGFAGIATEGIIAALALFGWGVTEQGLLHSAFFTISSISFVTTLLINLNPGMRFDGYYLLMDILRIDNLQSRSFAATRWFYRNFFLGMKIAPPEENIGGKRLFLMILYTVYTWTYRFFLYLSIAFIVYYKFTKLLGIFLFMVEIWYFIVMPFIREGSGLFTMRSHFSLNWRLVLTVTCACIFFLWLALPRPQTITVPAVVVPKFSQTLYAKTSGRITGLQLELGTRVTQGDSLLSIESREIDDRLKLLDHERKILMMKRDNIHLTMKDIDLLPEKIAEIVSVSTMIKSLEVQKQQNDMTAEISGEVTVWDERLVNGSFVATGDILGKIVNTDRIFLQGFVKERDISEVQPGENVFFISDAVPGRYPAIVRKISPVREETMDYVVLASERSGDLPVVRNNWNQLIMLESRFAVEADFVDPEQRFTVGQSGKLSIATRSRSVLGGWFRKAAAVILQESNF